jgi:hypothetical protein
MAGGHVEQDAAWVRHLQSCAGGRGLRRQPTLWQLMSATNVQVRIEGSEARQDDIASR